jgi:hypothetical protein
MPSKLRARATSYRLSAIAISYSYQSELSPAQRNDDVRRNISEGDGLNLDTLFAKHLRHSLGSANEVQDELDTLDEKGLLPDDDCDLIQETTEVRAMLAGLLNKVLRDVEAAKRGAKTRPKRSPRS